MLGSFWLWFRGKRNSVEEIVYCLSEVCNQGLSAELSAVDQLGHGVRASSRALLATPNFGGVPSGV